MFTFSTTIASAWSGLATQSDHLAFYRLRYLGAELTRLGALAGVAVAISHSLDTIRLHFDTFVASQTVRMSVTPLQAATDVLNRARGILRFDGGSEGVALPAYDVRRQALAMGVAALDTWMHWAIRRVPLDSLSPKLQQLEVPFGALVASGQRSLKARKSGVPDRPQVRARNLLNDRLLRMTFQSAKEWNTGFALLGVKSGLTNAGKAMNPSLTNAQVETRLNQLTHRRNCIVHEGDLRRLVRPQRISRSRLNRQEVDADLLWIERFLSAVDALV